jgi:NAD(P)-dependent dehydrogenase (short-subunit alcohol dehydrogenase family)
VSIWRGASALVTGAASGIGLALSEALVARGARVWLSDVDGDAAMAAADRLGERAAGAVLDVRDAVAFGALAARIAEEHGRLDHLFNNAGIGIAGEVHEQPLELWDRIVDVNVRGVMHGITAAYPIMVAQRGGHIVNTASLAGLAPVPLLTAYSMTKHAVVGLSASLRLEAERYGVGVHALCPAAIETPLLDTKGPEDLARPGWVPDIRRYLTRLAGPPYPVAKLAEAALRGVERDRGVIVVPMFGRLGVLLHRIAPGLFAARVRQGIAAELSERPPGDR